MSIENEIDRIRNNIAASYGAVEEKGGAVPEIQSSENLPEAIMSIFTGGSVNVLTSTIFKGRIRGDVNGDGKITKADSELLVAYDSGTVSLDTISRWCGDVTGDDSVDFIDVMRIAQFVEGTYTIPNQSDYYNNWTYSSLSNKLECWSIDIQVPDITQNSSVLIAISGRWPSNVFTKAEIIESGVRIFSGIPPIEDVKCTIFYGDGNKTCAVCVNHSQTPNDVGINGDRVSFTGQDDVSNWSLLGFNSETPNGGSVSIDNLRSITTGFAKNVTAASTDYDTSRARAISLHATVPTTNLVNGAIYGVYQ